ncbi:hypothetical protein Hanom_Chr11g01026661 [Helianthus anomalus]
MAFHTSISQMSRFYSFIWKELVSSDQKSMANFSSNHLYLFHYLQFLQVKLYLVYFYPHKKCIGKII